MGSINHDLERAREYHRDYYRIRRTRALELVGDSCSQCGSNVSLEFDHIEPDLKSFNIARNLTASNAAVIEELKKCQILCHACHLEKTRAERIAAGFTHGSMYGWSKLHCDCSECDAAKLLWYQERNSERRAGMPSRKKYRRRADAPHGSESKYRSGCRCDDCKAANAAKSRRLYAEKPK